MCHRENVGGWVVTTDSPSPPVKKRGQQSKRWDTPPKDEEREDDPGDGEEGEVDVKVPQRKRGEQERKWE